MSDFYSYLANITVPMLQGMVITLSVFAVTIVCSIPLGFIFTLMVRSRLKPVRSFAKGYIYVVRGTPLLLQIMFVYFGLPLLPVVGALRNA